MTSVLVWPSSSTIFQVQQQLPQKGMIPSDAFDLPTLLQLNGHGCQGVNAQYWPLLNIGQIQVQRHWSHPDEVPDLRQELRTGGCAAAKGLPTQPKAFLFTSARHLMTDRLRRNKVVSIEPMGDLTFCTS